MTIWAVPSSCPLTEGVRATTAINQAAFDAVLIVWAPVIYVVGRVPRSPSIVIALSRFDTNARF